MRILAISDEVTDALYHPNFQQLTGDIDLLVSCGDLPYGYMDFIVTQARVARAVFVHGNHDKTMVSADGERWADPPGWTNLDRRVVYFRELDLIVAGLQGSILYSGETQYQYTEREMAGRALKLIPQLLVSRARTGRYLDILVTHAPAQGIHDGPRGAHQGFPIHLRLIRRFEPRLLLHGHNHRYGQEAWHTRYLQTDVVNVHPYRTIDIDADGTTIGRRRRHG